MVCVGVVVEEKLAGTAPCSVMLLVLRSVPRCPKSWIRVGETKLADEREDKTDAFGHLS